MSNCGQACPYNTLDGCKVKEHNAICPLTNMATPIKEYRMTNADCIRAISDRELADFLSGKGIDVHGAGHTLSAIKQNLFCAFMKWLRMPADEVPDERR